MGSARDLIPGRLIRGYMVKKPSENNLLPPSDLNRAAVYAPVGKRFLRGSEW